MTPQIKQAVADFITTHKLTLMDVLEVGSMNVNGSVRETFYTLAGTFSYLGIDREAGPGVDRVCDITDLDALDANYDAIVCLEVLEHDPRFWNTLKCIREKLKPNGLLFLSTPTIAFPYHGYPKDYYRFTEDAYREVLMEGFEVLELRKVKDDVGQPGIIALGRLKS